MNQPELLKTLFVEEVQLPNDSPLQPFLFHLAEQLSEEGYRILYVSPKPVNKLPKVVISDTHNTNPDVWKRITFVYPESPEHLLELLQNTIKQCQAIIVERLDYFIEESIRQYGNKHNQGGEKCGLCRVYHLCVTLLKSVYFNIPLGQTGIVVISCRLPIPTYLSNLFYKNIWSCTESYGDIKLTSITAEPGQISEFVFKENDDSGRLLINTVFAVKDRDNNSCQQSELLASDEILK